MSCRYDVVSSVTYESCSRAMHSHVAGPFRSKAEAMAKVKAIASEWPSGLLLCINNREVRKMA